MKVKALAAAVLALAALHSVTALADADDDKWIKQCQADNKDEKGATPEIVTAYCTCMNNKMGSNESRSISQWEKSHPAEMKQCSKEAGWK